MHNAAPSLQEGASDDSKRFACIANKVHQVKERLCPFRSKLRDYARAACHHRGGRPVLADKRERVA